MLYISVLVELFRVDLKIIALPNPRILGAENSQKALHAHQVGMHKPKGSYITSTRAVRINWSYGSHLTRPRATHTSLIALEPRVISKALSRSSQPVVSICAHHRLHPHKQCKGREHDHCRTCDQGRTSFAGAIDTFIEGLHNVPDNCAGRV